MSPRPTGWRWLRDSTALDVRFEQVFGKKRGGDNGGRRTSRRRRPRSRPRANDGDPSAAFQRLGDCAQIQRRGLFGSAAACGARGRVVTFHLANIRPNAPKSWIFTPTSLKDRLSTFLRVRSFTLGIDMKPAQRLSARRRGGALAFLRPAKSNGFPRVDEMGVGHGQGKKSDSSSHLFHYD